LTTDMCLPSHVVIGVNRIVGGIDLHIQDLDGSLV